MVAPKRHPATPIRSTCPSHAASNISFGGRKRPLPSCCFSFSTFPYLLFTLNIRSSAFKPCASVVTPCFFPSPTRWDLRAGFLGVLRGFDPRWIGALISGARDHLSTWTSQAIGLERIQPRDSATSCLSFFPQHIQKLRRRLLFLHSICRH